MDILSKVHKISNMFYFTKLSFVTFTNNLTRMQNAECKRFRRVVYYFMIMNKLGHIHISEFYSGNIATAKISVTVL